MNHGCHVAVTYPAWCALYQVNGDRKLMTLDRVYESLSDAADLIHVAELDRGRVVHLRTGANRPMTIERVR